MAKRKRRAFTKEFKTEAVRVVQASGNTGGGRWRRELDLTERALRDWVRQAKIDAGRGQPGALTTDERAELAPAAVRGADVVTDGAKILEKATAFVAKERA